MTTPVAACPFCSHLHCEPFEIDRDMWAVMCSACYCIGPVGYCTGDAVEQWNLRLPFDRARLDMDLSSAARILDRYRQGHP
jgi:hypothetical protein